MIPSQSRPPAISVRILPISRFSSPGQVQYLARHFTIKPVPAMGLNYGTGISYEREAREVLCATSEPAVHHALVSFGALRRVFEQYGDPAQKIPAIAPGVQHDLQEYDYALKSLVTRFSTHNAAAIQYSLLRCQLFMSIELAMDDFTSATQHFIRGLRIMHQSRSRPYLDVNGTFIPPKTVGMPSVDTFAIKLFLTPCPDGLTEDFLLSSEEYRGNSAALSAERSSVLRANMRLAALGRSTLALLEDISQLSSASQAPTLVSHRLTILQNLRTWREDFTAIEKISICQLTC